MSTVQLRTRGCPVPRTLDDLDRGHEPIAAFGNGLDGTGSKPRPPPSALRTAAICTERFASSTTVSGHRPVYLRLLVDQIAMAFDEESQRIERFGADSHDANSSADERVVAGPQFERP